MGERAPQHGALCQKNTQLANRWCFLGATGSVNMNLSLQQAYWILVPGTHSLFPQNELNLLLVNVEIDPL